MADKAGDPLWSNDDELPDPTMAECCRRDALQRARVDKLKAELRTVDPSMRNLDIKSEVFKNDPGTQMPSSDENEELYLDDDDDDVLIRLRDQRMNELHNNMKGGSNVVDLKLGHVETISAANLLGIVQHSKEPCIVHIHQLAALESSHADQLFHELSYQYKQTRFLRVEIDQDTAIQSFEHTNSSAEAGIMCFVKGALMKQVPVCAFVRCGSFLEEKVVKFLKNMNMLHKSIEDTDKSVTSDSDDEDPWMGEPCVTCGRCYPHKHFPPAALYHAAKEEFRSGSGSD